MIFEVWRHLLWLVSFFQWWWLFRKCKINDKTTKMVLEVDSAWTYTLNCLEYLKPGVPVYPCMPQRTWRETAISIISTLSLHQEEKKGKLFFRFAPLKSLFSPLPLMPRDPNALTKFLDRLRISTINLSSSAKPPCHGVIVLVCTMKNNCLPTDILKLFEQQVWMSSRNVCDVMEPHDLAWRNSMGDAGY